MRESRFPRYTYRPTLTAVPKKLLLVVAFIFCFVVSIQFKVGWFSQSQKRSQILARAPQSSDEQNRPDLFTTPDLDPVSSAQSSDAPYAGHVDLQTAHQRSPCSDRQQQFVGSQPLFPPCLPSVSPGIATWGEYPYLGPFNYSRHSTNPCFYTPSEPPPGQQQKLRCVPYFMVAGFSKCGTTTLYIKMVKHPQIVKGIKEVRWFSKKRFPEYETEPYQDFSGYLQYFDKLTKAVAKDIATVGRSNKIIGDYSNQAVNEVFEWPRLSGNEGCQEPRVINANHIRHLNPDIKVIFIMREPVQRLYSRFLFDYSRDTINEYRTPIPVNHNQRNQQGFHAFVVDAVQRYKDCFQRFSLRYCVYNRTLWESVHGLKIQDSMYTILLEDWLRVIPRDQLLFLRLEDFNMTPTQTLTTVFKFLELDPVSSEVMTNMLDLSIVVKGHPIGPMLPQTQRLLQEFFQPFNHRLAEQLHDPRFLWENVNTS